MPQTKVLKSLRTLTLEYIVENMDKFCRPTNMNFGTSKINRFALVADILLKIMSRLKSKNQLRDQYLDLLLTPHLRKLDLSMADNNSMHDLLQFASDNCPKLMCLWIGDSNLDLSHCFNLVCNFEYLQMLNIARSQPADTILNLLGIHCIHLRELHVNNTRVSDEGIHGLCVAGKCKSIKILNIVNLTDTRVSLIGLQMALSNLLELEDLKHDSLVNVLSDLHQTSLRDVPNRTSYALSVLSIWNTSEYRKGNLSEAISCCPLLTTVEITAPDDFYDRDLRDLLLTTNLRHLTIAGTQTSEISFDGGVAPLLREKIFGESLKSLTIVNIPDINIRFLVKYCPNLSMLRLNLFSFNEFHLNHTDELNEITPLYQLETLSVVRCSCANSLLCLLSSPSLVSITLHHCFALNDDVLTQTEILHSFSKLEQFEVCGNSRITKNGIDLLMSENNCLRAIKLRNCSRLTRNDFAYWGKKILDGNWDLLITE